MSEPAGAVPFVAVLRDLLEWLAASGFRGAIVGGVAASILGRPRATRDVDVLTVVDQSRWSEILDRAGDHHFEPRVEEPLDFAHRHRVLLLRHEPSGTEVDVTLGGLPFEAAVVERAVNVKAAGLEIPVATPEDLMIMKAVARRPRDRVDVEALLQHHPDADLDYVKQQLREFSAALGQEEIFEDFLTLLRQSR